MKKVLLFTGMLLMGAAAFGQTNTFPETGKVGIGTLTPTSTLHVKTRLATDGATAVSIDANGDDSNELYIGQNINVTHTSTSSGGSVMGLNIIATGMGTGHLNTANGINVVVNTGHRTGGASTTSQFGGKFVLYGSTGTSSSASNITYYGILGQVVNTTAVGESSKSYGVYGKATTVASGSAYGVYASASGGANNYGIYSAAGQNYFNGNVGIGTASPSEKLSVNGNVRAKEVKVETANWPDYVFAKEYLLPSLQETAAHIRDKGHLPGIPSAGEVKANGVELGEMNAKLLQKIEELTLYLIDQNQQLEKQNLNIQELNDKVNTLQKNQ